MSNTNAAKYDANMRSMSAGGMPLAWHAPNAAPFRLEGFAFYNQDRVYRRLPLHPCAPLPEAVDHLANHTAGGQIRFRSDSQHVALSVLLPEEGNMVHMARTGQNGFDLYVGEPTHERFFNCAKYAIAENRYEVMLFDCEEVAMREFTLNFPLYNGVSQVEVGLDPDAAIESPTGRAISGAILVYGTSITQGGCASRPGMCYTNILARRLNCEFMNMGFSGSGRGEPEVARVIAQIADLCMLVLDYEANCMDLERLRQTMPVFVGILRERYPQAPILVVSRIARCIDGFSKVSREATAARREFQRDYVAARRSAGDAHIHFLDGSTVVKDAYYEFTVDGSHPTDLGFMLMAESFEPVYRAILGL